MVSVVPPRLHGGSTAATRDPSGHASLDYLLRGDPAPQHKPTNVEIPAELHAFAQEIGLSYRQTVVLLDIDRSVKAHRRDERVVRNKEYWRELYKGVKQFLEDKR
jgi:hypothetical protein